jgi:transcription antitermination factor NusG
MQEDLFGFRAGRISHRVHRDARAGNEWLADPQEISKKINLGVNGRSYMQHYSQPVLLENVPRVQPSRWFAIHTRYQHEKLVAATLQGKGLEVFLPTYDASHRWSDRTKRVTLPLFPGYLFFANDIDQRIQILSTPGVNAIIRAGNLPAEISNEEIAAIRRMVESTLRVEPHPFLNEGDFVRIKAGPLEGLEGIVSRKKDAVRLVLSIQILGQSAAVEIDGCAVERLKPSRAVVS